MIVNIKPAKHQDDSMVIVSILLMHFLIVLKGVYPSIHLC